jgi:hypothetical protein
MLRIFIFVSLETLFDLCRNLNWGWYKVAYIVNIRYILCIHFINEYIEMVTSRGEK